MAEEDSDKVEELIAYKDGPDVLWMLAHGSEGESGQDHSHGRSCKAGSLRKVDDQVKVGQKQEAAAACVDEAEGHSVFFCEIAGIAGVL